MFVKWLSGQCYTFNLESFGSEQTKVIDNLMSDLVLWSVDAGAARELRKDLPVPLALSVSGGHRDGSEQRALCVAASARSA